VKLGIGNKLGAGCAGRPHADGRLKQLVADKPMLEKKLHVAQTIVSSCKAWLDLLPAGTTLEPVAVKADGRDLRLNSLTCALSPRRHPTSGSVSRIMCIGWRNRRSLASAKASG
jgi:hypothetical protein